MKSLVLRQQNRSLQIQFSEKYQLEIKKNWTVKKLKQMKDSLHGLV